MTLGKSSTNRSLPINATTTKVHATSKSATPSTKSRPPLEAAGNSNGESITGSLQKNEEQRPEQPDQSEPTSKPSTEDANPHAASGQAQDPQGTWLAWLSKKDAPTSSLVGVQGQQSSPQSDTAVATPTPTSTNENTEAHSVTNEQSKDCLNVNNKRSWYHMWAGDALGGITKKEESSRDHASPATESPQSAKRQTQCLDIPTPAKPQSKSASQASSLEISAPPPLREDGTKSSGWVFWSRDRKRPSSTNAENEPHVGEIAVSDTLSQTKPRRASISLQDDSTRPVVEPRLHEEQSKIDVAQKSALTPQALTESPQTPKTTKPQRNTAASMDSSTTNAKSRNATAVVREPVEVGTPRTASPAPSKTEYSNLLLPPIKETLHLEETPSILQQIARLLYYTKEPELKHLSLVKDPPRIKNALAIGVHGYFPAPLIRTVLGQPTGTSIKFADMAAKCIKKWTQSHGYDCEVKSAALEGEGRIAERVELLWKLLLNWIDEIRRSDFVMIACHSQGVPVAIMLVAKLLQFGCISAARVGICAMAGVNMGPFQEYKSRWISGSAGELFEFSDPNSKVSRNYFAAIEEVLRSGLVKLTFVGSIDDQLVSMDSSIFAPISHPHIYRAVFIDSRIHAPNFLSHLVGFALKLRNVGVPDHGLIKELSSPLAGSLYGGEGHSRIYEDDAVYDIAISFALETNALQDALVSRRPTSSSGTNPYILPFAMRGILEEDYVKKELQQEAQELLAQFDEWKPMTKALKDVKFRLEGIRSKL
ncbi:hypothetical protein A1O3_04697 [Capronia epimyces CBS 606.96]|uniref:YMC020W-like alpha/beta hydrolase domain-containing protein n=1 Tax=Capronia epimyces CBS 606.96 TaxID=1182542 RepID=W9Y311_9EURO|nr:uncharacterized protein A1O3_04697 [Capronia epimyces CBS 606.96]EXJ84030.1 hypothetical protein A1O3_04697 [Capronia epimyces CBS 606.96]